MPISLGFSLTAKKGRDEDTISTLKRLGFNVLEARESQEIVCTITIENDDAMRTANICSSINNIDGVARINTIFYDTKPEKFLSRRNPLIPMVISSVVTFFIIYQTILQFHPQSSHWEIFQWAGIPTIVTFISQLGFFFQKNR